MPELPQIIVWLIVGALAGYLIGMVMTGKKEGYGIFWNLGIGLAGALIGGVLFQLIPIFTELNEISFSLRDLLAALIGSALLMLGFWIYKRTKK